MITEVILPKLGQTMEEGTIVEWIRKEGDPIKRGDILFTVESDKAVLEVEATARGFLRKILIPEGQKVPVLSVVALITQEADEDISPTAHAGGHPSAAGADLMSALIPEAEPTQPQVASQEEPGCRIYASPRARKTAREKGVDLSLLTGTGPDGRIVERDVLESAAVMAREAIRAAPATTALPKATPMAIKAASALGVDLATVSGTGVSGRIMHTDVVQQADVEAGRPRGAAPTKTTAMTAPPVPPISGPAEATVDGLPMSGLRRIIAERMSDSAAATAHVTLVTEADATVFVQIREQIKTSVAEEWGFAPGYNDLLGLIVARALREFPYVNARLSADGSSIERLPNVNLGMAVDTDRGLLVPVIRNADLKGLRTLGAEFRALVERARVGRALPDDLGGGTFTITNLGMYDIDAFTPIINLPEAAILGVGRIQSKPVVWEGAIVARQMWTLSLTFDHRLIDGAPAARFLQRIKQLVENPYLLLALP